MKLSSVAINGIAQTQGIWIGEVPNLPGVRLKVRADRNQDYRRLETKLIREVPSERRVAGLDPKDEDEIRARCLAETVLEDWSGIEYDDGEAIECTAEQRFAILSNPDYAVLHNGVSYAAMLAASQKREDAGRDAGN